MGVCVNANTAVVPANAGTHTLCHIVWAHCPRPFRLTNAGGYGSLLSQGRRWGNKMSDISTVIASAAKQSIFLFAARWIASRSLSSGAHSRDPLARNDVDRVSGTAAFSRREAPEALLLSFAQRGRGECRAHDAPAVSCAIVVVERTRVTTSTPKSPGIPARNGFNGLLRALPGDRALLPPSPCGLKVLSSPVEPNEPPQDLTPASRRQDHTTSPSASCAVVLRAAYRSRRAIRPALRTRTPNAAASTASRPAFVTIAIRPLCGTRQRRL